MSLRFSVRLNNDLPVATYRRTARAAEAAGIDQLWVSNDLFLRSGPVIIAAMLEATERLHVGSGILNPYTIHPAEIAMMASTFDEASGNRFNLGMAAGAGEFLEWVGLEQARPLTAMRSAIEAIRALQAGRRPESDERFHYTEGAYLRFEAPRQTPIYLGATGPRMLELCGELGDGGLPLLFPPEHYSTVRELVGRGAEKRSPDLPELDLAACVWVSIDEQQERAERLLAEKIAYYGSALSPLILERLGLERSDFAAIQQKVVQENDLAAGAALVDQRMMEIGVAGTARKIAARLESLIQAGARHISFGPPLGRDPAAAVELLGREVLPRLRAVLP